MTQYIIGREAVGLYVNISLVEHKWRLFQPKSLYISTIMNIFVLTITYINNMSIIQLRGTQLGLKCDNTHQMCVGMPSLLISQHSKYEVHFRFHRGIIHINLLSRHRYWYSQVQNDFQSKRPGDRLNIKMSSCQYRDSHNKDKTVTTVLS